MSNNDYNYYTKVDNTLAIALLEGFNKYVPTGLKAFVTYDHGRHVYPGFIRDRGAVIDSIHVENNVYVGGQLERDRNFHNGPVWPSTLSAYGKAYLRVYQHSGESFMRRLLVGFEAEMSELCVGTLNELYDGNPPYKGHGGMSYAPSVAAALTVFNELRAMEQSNAENNEQK